MQYGARLIKIIIKAIVVVYLTLRRCRERRVDGVFRRESDTGVLETEIGEGEIDDGRII